ncbi:DUF3455 domain-containing protein [Bordetella flabilis]|uniref:DUF3455 domain-containing protein n=1 Tax=Bordetella flabilis TaxID=463014 RepID=A0A193GCC0_9BORD|nr:DUF3455 domain-containing protein [Bordetella flabilis]ANN77667.1 hypothetical protein BAU07_11615 [Bordetella flabilis]
MPVRRPRAARPIAAALAGTALLVARAPSASPIDPPTGTPVLTLTAVGYQAYSCEYDASRRLQWQYIAPHARLYDANGRPLVEHGPGPTWRASDGSGITGRVIGQIPSEAPRSVPQLLLASTSVAGPGMLAAVRYVQRVGTVGGAAPEAACATEHQSAESPYMAQYVFLR